MVVQELKAIQEREGYVSDKALHELSGRINVPVYELHGVASFYPHFRLKPPPKIPIHRLASSPSTRAQISVSRN